MDFLRALQVSAVSFAVKSLNEEAKMDRIQHLRLFYSKTHTASNSQREFDISDLLFANCLLGKPALDLVSCA